MEDETFTIGSRRLFYVNTPHFPHQFNVAAFLKIIEETRLLEKMNDFFLADRSALWEILNAGLRRRY